MHTRLAPSILLALAVAAEAYGAAPVTQADVDSLRAAMNAAGVAESDAVIAAGMTLRVGPGLLALRTGRIYPARALAWGDAAAIAREYVFVGDGTLELAPEDPIEARQLEIFSGARRLREPIGAALLVIASDEAAALIRGRPKVESPGGPALDRAQSLLAAWRSSNERRLLGVEEGILADVLGDRGADGVFVGAFEGRTLGRFLLSVEPRATEQVAMGAFVPFDLTAKERRQIGRMVHREQRRGRLLGVSEDSLGSWDSWLSMPFERDGAKVEGQPSFEPTHYEIEANVASGGGLSDAERRRRCGRYPPSAARRSFRYCASALSGANEMNGTSPILSSGTGMSKRSRNWRSASLVIFFAWCAIIWPSPDSPIP